MKKVEKTARSANEALELAAKELGIAKENLEYEVVNEVGRGLIGLLVGKEITISAWERGTVEVNIPASLPKKEEPKKIKKEKPAEFKAEQAKQIMPKSDDKDLFQALEGFLSKLLSLMGIQAAFKITRTESDRIDVDVSGDKMGLLIGKRGDTLDAVQYLAMLYINKGKQGYIKVGLDTEGYRAKREETLIRLAHGLESRVLRFGRSITLEPMTPYERRIIHAALQDNNKLRTYSVGDEPNRKVVVSLK